MSEDFKTEPKPVFTPTEAIIAKVAKVDISNQSRLQNLRELAEAVDNKKPPVGYFQFEITDYFNKTTDVRLRLRLTPRNIRVKGESGKYEKEFVVVVSDGNNSTDTESVTEKEKVAQVLSSKLSVSSRVS